MAGSGTDAGHPPWAGSGTDAGHPPWAGSGTDAGHPPWAGFRFVRDVIPSDEHHRVHLDNLALAELLFDARNAYVTEAVGITWEAMFATGRNLVIRRLEIDFQQEVPAGIALKVGVRAAVRSRRTVTFDEAVWRVDPRAVIAVAKSVHLVVRLDEPGAIDLPADVVHRFESFEGRLLRSADGS